jgi:hypothetical protein
MIAHKLSKVLIAMRNNKQRRVGRGNHRKGEGQGQGKEGCGTRQSKGGKGPHQERVKQPFDAGGGGMCNNIRREGGHGV